jgi:hypothetical protein
MIGGRIELGESLGVGLMIPTILGYGKRKNMSFP